MIIKNRFTGDFNQATLTTDLSGNLDPHIE
jgi:hypothetical protein